MRNELSKSVQQQNECAIVNLDTSFGQGTHWCAYKKYGNIVFWFDSYGNLPPPLELITYFLHNKIYYNYKRFQNFGTYLCGHLCLQFLLAVEECQ